MRKRASTTSTSTRSRERTISGSRSSASSRRRDGARAATDDTARARATPSARGTTSKSTTSTAGTGRRATSRGSRERAAIGKSTKRASASGRSAAAVTRSSARSVALPSRGSVRVAARRLDLDVTIARGHEWNTLIGERWYCFAVVDGVRIAGAGESPWSAIASLADAFWRRFELGELGDSLAKPLGVPACPWKASPLGELPPRASASRRSVAKPEALDEIWDPVKERTGGQRVPRRCW